MNISFQHNVNKATGRKTKANAGTLEAKAKAKAAVNGP